jgi:hypothetical protein
MGLVDLEDLKRAEFFGSLLYKAVEDHQNFGISNPAACPTRLLVATLSIRGLECK